jgi:large subunit ribosomal protein LP1
MSTNKCEQAVAYAALILADESITVTADKLQDLLKAAGIEDVEPIWTTIFAKALEGKDVKKVLTEIAGTRPTVGELADRKPNDQDEKVADDGDNGGIGCELFPEGSDEEDFGMSLFD